MININELSINLREWTSKDFEVIHFQTKKIRELAGNAGTGSDKFNNICSRLLDLVLNGNISELYISIKKPIDVRAFSYLLSTEEKFVQKIKFNKNLINAILFPRKKISLLSLQQLVRAFFVYFDDVFSTEDVVNLGEFISQQLEQRKRISTDSSIGIWRAFRKNLFTLNGPGFIVKTAKKENEELDKVFNMFSLNGFSDGKFQQVCRFHYYLEVLKEIPIGSDHEILQEVVKREVYEAPGLEGRLLGHAILSIIIDRAEKYEISESWQNIILSIAGDPRVSKSNHKYQTWWMLLGEERINRVKGWLSRFDLNIFLDTLEDFSYASGNSSLKRMFPSRKKFLEGLIEHGLVSNSRLYLCRHAVQYIRTHYNENEIPMHAQSYEADTSMIYLQVGHCHIIEGSHNFQIRVFPKYPNKSQLLDYSKQMYRRSELSNEIEYAYYQEYGHNTEPPATITHAIGLNWQRKVIKYLQEQGIELDISRLLTEEDFKVYKRKYPIPKNSFHLSGKHTSQVRHKPKNKRTSTKDIKREKLDSIYYQDKTGQLWKKVSGKFQKVSTKEYKEYIGYHKSSDLKKSGPKSSLNPKYISDKSFDTSSSELKKIDGSPLYQDNNGNKWRKISGVFRRVFSDFEKTESIHKKSSRKEKQHYKYENILTYPVVDKAYIIEQHERIEGLRKFGIDTNESELLTKKEFIAYKKLYPDAK